MSARRRRKEKHEKKQEQEKERRKTVNLAYLHHISIFLSKELFKILGYQEFCSSVVITGIVLCTFK